MTPEEIDKLPRPPLIPARDMMLCVREVQTPGGVFLPDASADKVQTCRVLVVGGGVLLDSMVVKKCPYRRGDRLFVTPTDGYPITLDASTYWLFEVNEVMGELTDDKTLASGRETI